MHTGVGWDFGGPHVCLSRFLSVSISEWCEFEPMSSTRIHNGFRSSRTYQGMGELPFQNSPPLPSPQKWASTPILTLVGSTFPMRAIKIFLWEKCGQEVEHPGNFCPASGTTTFAFPLLQKSFVVLNQKSFHAQRDLKSVYVYLFLPFTALSTAI